MSDNIGTFSVWYSGSHGIICAVDWDWIHRREWARSDKESDIQWIPLKGLDEDTYILLLHHFGLNLWSNEFPPERILELSPRDLWLIRREKERQHGLVKKEIYNMTLGFTGISAENYK